MTRYEIAEYRVIDGSDPQRCARAVNEAIMDGWQPYGSMVSMAYVDDSGAWVSYSQPMVRHKDVTP